MDSRPQISDNINVIKTRDDREPIYFNYYSDNNIRIEEGFACSWTDPKKAFSFSKLRQRIEPWLTALFQSENLSLLAGSGLTHAVADLMKDVHSPGMSGVEFSTFNQQIQKGAQETAKKANRDRINFEDQIRVSNELLIGLEHYCRNDNCGELTSDIAALRDELKEKLGDFVAEILKCEKEFVTSGERDIGFDYLVNFLLSPASRTGTRERLHIFTTNYDRFVEIGAEIAGLHLIDRFVGSISPIFRSSRLKVDMHYNPPGIRGEPRYLEGVIRFTKLHGSVDWISSGLDIRRLGLPFGGTNIDSYFLSSGFENLSPMSLMIYPNSAKDRETSEYPYVDLFRDFAAEICRPNTTLVTYGFGFGDEHINRVIEDMLTIPSTHLVIISYSDPMGRIMKLYEKTPRKSQISLLLGNHLGSIKPLVDYYLPKPAIDRTSYRMAELIQARLGLKSGGKKKDDEGAD